MGKIWNIALTVHSGRAAPPALGVHGERDIPYFTPAAQMRFPL
jgi:hypothetical protein